MRRREFLGVLGSAAVAWPLTAPAQQSAMPVIAFLRNTSFDGFEHFVAAFRHGLNEAGFAEGQNVLVEYHSAEGQPDRLRVLAAELVRRPLAAIVGNSLSIFPVKAATTTIPIVFAGGGDPIEQGLVASLNRPGGNVTGVNFLSGVLGAKRLQLLHQLVPKATTIGMLVNPNTVETELERKDVQAAAHKLGRQLIVLDASSDRDIEVAFETFVRRGVGALLVGTGNFTFANRKKLVALTLRHRLPAGHIAREAVMAGALMSYGPSIADAYRLVGVYAGRILKGEKPADLPVIQAIKFEFVLNLKTAKALGLDLHPQLLATVDEVIE
jgi:putative ABC transport system substrate-binding protein